MSQVTHDKLRRAQVLLGHRVPSGDVAQVLDLALDALITRLEKQKIGSTDRPRGAGATTSARHIPAHVRRAVWERDEGRCTFVSEVGRRCPARRPLEFDHVQEVARGGTASVSGIRLRCRAHNQFTAEQTFGVEFMRSKREEARAKRLARRREAPRTDSVTPAHIEEVIPALLALGYRAGEARDAAGLCADMPEATTEQRVKRALTYFLPRTLARSRAVTAWAGG